eukprot:5943513-Prymnesium_polylepis.1
MCHGGSLPPGGSGRHAAENLATRGVGFLYCKELHCKEQTTQGVGCLQYANSTKLLCCAVWVQLRSPPRQSGSQYA